MAWALINQQSQTTDAENRIHTVMYHRLKKGDPSKFGGAPTKYHHYWRSADAKWHQIQLNLPVGKRPKLFADHLSNLYLICNVSGSLRIYAASSASQWKDWSEIFKENGPFENEMLGGAESSSWQPRTRQWPLPGQRPDSTRQAYPA